MATSRQVKGEDDLTFRVTEEEVREGKRTTAIDGTIRYIPGRKRHSRFFRASVDHHGHLIADALGGPGHKTSGNIVAIHGDQNGAAGQYGRMGAAVIARPDSTRLSRVQGRSSEQDEDDVRNQIGVREMMRAVDPLERDILRSADTATRAHGSARRPCVAAL